MAKLKSGFRGERAIILPSSVVDDISNDLLGKELHITDIGYYPQAVYHYRKRTAEEAAQYILIYCIEGEGWFKIHNKKHLVGANQFFILPKNVEHAYGSNSSKPWTIYWIHFDGEKASFFANGFDVPTNISPNNDSRIEDRLRIFEEMFLTLKKGYSKYNLYYTITSLFYFLGSIKFLGEYRDSIKAQDKQSDIIDHVIHYMHENIERKLSLKDFALHANISPSHLSALFQKKTGYSPLRYFIHLEIQEACHYLDFTDLKINQICYKFGFEDAFYFSRIFTKIMGVPPTEYRLEKKG